MKKSFAVFLIVCLVAVGIAAQISFAAPVTLKFMTWEPKIFQDAIAKYEKETGNKVEIVADDPAKVLAMGAAGEAIDVLELHAGGQALNLMMKGYLMPLDSLMAKGSFVKKSELLPINNLYRWNGKEVGKGPYYGIMKDFGDSVMWYNKRLFDKAGIPYPAANKPLTAAEFRELCKKLTVYKDGKVLQYGWAEPSAGTTWTNAPDVGNMARAAISNGQKFGNYAFTKDNRRLSFDENTKGVLDYVTMLVAMAREDHSYPSPLDPSSSWSGDLFIHDQAAMMITGPWFVGWCELSNPKAKSFVGFAPTPLLWGPKQVFPIDTNCGYVLMKGANKAAYKLLEFLAYYGGMDNAKIAWNLPTIQSLQKLLPRNDPYWKPYFTEQDRVLKMEQVYPPNPYAPEWQPLNNAMFGANLNDVFTGKTSVKDWLKAGVKAANAKIAEGAEQ